MPWFDRIVITTPATAGAQSLGTHVLRLNSIFDPDLTGGVHQPSGRDKLVTYGYLFYRVLEAQVNLTWIQTTGEEANNNNHFTICGYELTDNSSNVYTDFRAFVEAKHTKADLLMPQNTQWEGNQKTVHQSYTYRPESWQYHVQNEGIEERWTPVGTSPP